MGKTILIVDDEPVVLEVATAILQHAGYEVMTAMDGGTAVELCREAAKPIDLLLTDVDMPRVSGAELAECLANRKRGFPVMFMRSDGDDSEPKKAFAAQRGMDGSATVEKPFTKRQLLSAVETLLERSEADRQPRLKTD